MHARSALFTLFGDVVRPSGGEAWLSTLAACMGALGFSPEATRTALHRMATEGWVQPRRAGRYAAYRLTERGIDRLEEAAARIYRLRSTDWDGRWRLLVAPDAQRHGDLARALRWMGFGLLGTETWVSPHDHGARLNRVLDEHGHRPLATFATDAAQADPARDRAIVAEAWDLADLREGHAGFLDTWRDTHTPADPEAAFRTRVRLVHHWRSFLFSDPGLPVSLLPTDWLGDEAFACFRDLYAAVETPSWAFYAQARAGAPAARGDGDLAPARNPSADPFARGLAALGGGPPDQPARDGRAGSA